MSDYQVTIATSLTQEGSYRTIAEQMSDWWTPMSAKFLAVGDRAKTHFGGQSYWIFEAATLNQPSLIELDCCESLMVADSLKDPEEWKGTRLRFEIFEQTVRFTHIGLSPAKECFDMCKQGWDFYLLQSLKQVLNGQPGAPNAF